MYVFYGTVSIVCLCVCLFYCVPIPIPHLRATSCHTCHSNRRTKHLTLSDDDEDDGGGHTKTNYSALASPRRDVRADMPE